jgi:hypothetical protein
MIIKAYAASMRGAPLAAVRSGLLDAEEIPIEAEERGIARFGVCKVGEPSLKDLRIKPALREKVCHQLAKAIAEIARTIGRAQHRIGLNVDDLESGGA